MSKTFGLSYGKAMQETEKETLSSVKLRTKRAQ